MNKSKYSKLNKLCIIAIVISMIIGYLNPYENGMSIIYSFWYASTILIYFIIVKVSKKIRGGTLSKSGDKHIGSKIIKVLAIGVLCFYKITCFSIQYKLNLGKTDIGINFTDNEFLLNNALLLFILATIAEIAVVIIFSKRIWAENEMGDGNAL